MGRFVPEYSGDFSAVDTAVRSLLMRRTPGTLRIGVISARTKSFRVRVDADGNFGDSLLLLAVTEGGLEATPTAGENAGRRLVHSSVVRSVKVLPAQTVDAQIDVPVGVDVTRASLIGIVQEKRTMRILAAARAAFPRLSNAWSSQAISRPPLPLSIGLCEALHQKAILMSWWKVV
jgi:hypothetical protein